MLSNFVEATVMYVGFAETMVGEGWRGDGPKVRNECSAHNLKNDGGLRCLVGLVFDWLSIW